MIVNQADIIMDTYGHVNIRLGYGSIIGVVTIVSGKVTFFNNPYLHEPTHWCIQIISDVISGELFRIPPVLNAIEKVMQSV